MAEFTPYLDEVRNLFQLGLSLLLLIAAAAVAFAPRATRERALLAFLLGLLFIYNLLQVSTAIGLPAATTEDVRTPWFGFWRQLGFLIAGATLALLWAYPRPPAWRSWHGAVFAVGAALWGLGYLLFFVDKGALYSSWPDSPGRRTLLAQLTGGWLWNLWLTVLVFSSMARGRTLPAEQARASTLLGPAAIAANFTVAGLTAGQLVGLGLGVDASFLAFREALIVPGDCCGITRALLDLAQVAPFAVAAFAAWRWQARFPAALLAVGLGWWLLSQVTAYNLVAFNAVFLPLVALHLLARPGALPGGTLRPRTLLGLALVAMTLVFVLFVAALVTATQDPLGLATAIFVGALLAGATAWAVLPEGLRPGLAGALPDPPAPAASPGGAPSLAPGGVALGKYRIREPLGEGAYGTTWLADDTVAGRRVVLKALRAGADEDGALVREAKALAALQHPHVVTLYEVAQVGGRTLLVMEHAAGGSLGARLARGPLPLAEWRRVALGTLAALEAIHRAGLVHRDVKPSNVLLTAEGEAKLADFGIAALPGAEATMAGLRDGATVGTVRFMSPEQARGRATARSDLFSAAATLYEALTGQPYLAPAPGETAAELQLRAAFAKPFPRAAPVPPELRAWFAKALHPEPEKRFATAAAMGAALERALA